MAITLTTLVDYPIPGAVKAELTATASGNFVRLWCTGAPAGSKKATALSDAVASRIEEFAGTPGIISLQLEKGGVYTFTAQEYTQVAATYGGGYAGSADAVPSETKIGSENTLTIEVGQCLESRTGAPGYGQATLRLYVWSDTVRATTKAVHGEATPSLHSATTGRATTAINDATVLVSVAALVDQTASTLVGDLDDLIDDLAQTMSAHMASATYHNAADTEGSNALDDVPAVPSTPEGIVACAKILRQRLDWHLLSNAGIYHGAGHDKVPDYINAMISGMPGAADMTGAVIALADVWRAYEAHRISATHHSPVDTVNTMTETLAPLLVVHRDVLNALRLFNPTSPAVINSGATTLQHAAGFMEVK